MKIKIPKIKKNYKKENFEINPNLYWRLIVSIFFVLTILSFVFGISIYKQITKGDTIISGNGSKKVEQEKKVRINKVLEYFSEREKKSAEIIQSPLPVVDPSL